MKKIILLSIIIGLGTSGCSTTTTTVSPVSNISLELDEEDMLDHEVDIQNYVFEGNEL